MTSIALVLNWNNICHSLKVGGVSIGLVYTLQLVASLGGIHNGLACYIFPRLQLEERELSFVLLGL
jgi:uncharacterized protein (DUF4213/DUF364 family)